MIQSAYADQLVGHISRDASAIEGREKPAKKAQHQEKVKGQRKRGRPKKGKVVEPKLTRLQKQQQMTLEDMLDDLPTPCDVGTKKNSKGYKETWIGL